jgi:hypothetical protein
MNHKTVIFAASFLAGMLFFCTYQEWLIISWHRPSHHTQTSPAIETKNITLWREKNNNWIHESVHILWSQNHMDNFKLLTTTWLAWLYDEQVLSKKLIAESVLFSPSGYEMYVSFDHNPFEKQWSIHQKESFINALLKNYKENGCTASYLYVLVHHKPLQDIHLDFSEPWDLSNSL